MINRSICLAVVFNISRTNELQIGIYCYVAQVAAHTTTRLTKVTITPPCGRMTRTTSDIRGRWSNRSWLRLDPRHLQLTVFEARPVPPVRRNTRRQLPDTERPAESSVSVSQYTSPCGRGTAGAAGVVSRRDASERRCVVNAFKYALWRARRSIFRPKMHYIAGFCVYSLIFWGERGT